MAIIKTIDLSDNTIIADRSVSVINAYAIDINQSDGTYAVVEPYGVDSSYNGRVMIYPSLPFQKHLLRLNLKPSIGLVACCIH
jgi:hypothetical protein